MSAIVQVFGRRQWRAAPHARRPASEKRQGTKSRGGEALSVPPALWGFGRGVKLSEIGSSCPPSRCAGGWVWVTVGRSGGGVAGGDWRRETGPLSAPAVSGGCAGWRPAGVTGITGMVDRRRWHHEVSMLSAVGSDIKECSRA